MERLVKKQASLEWIVGGGLSLGILLLAVQTLIPVNLTLLEAIAVVSYAWSVWLLAKNRPLGWWVGLVGVVLYGIVFYQVQLYAEVAIQGFYFVTSLQAIYIWLKGGSHQQERPVGHVSPKWMGISAVLVVVAVIGLRALLIAIRGAAPFWDALTTVLSVVAHLYLMGRYVESWYLWILVDTIYVPLYASRELYFTSILYAVFWGMAVRGLMNFRQIYRVQQLQQAEAMQPEL